LFELRLYKLCKIRTIIGINKINMEVLAIVTHFNASTDVIFKLGKKLVMLETKFANECKTIGIINVLVLK